MFSPSVVSNSLRPFGLEPTRLFCPWHFPGKNTGVGSHSLLHRIFLTQGWNPGLPHCRLILYCLSQGVWCSLLSHSTVYTIWVVYTVKWLAAIAVNLGHLVKAALAGFPLNHHSSRFPCCAFCKEVSILSPYLFRWPLPSIPLRKTSPCIIWNFSAQQISLLFWLFICLFIHSLNQ